MAITPKFYLESRSKGDLKKLLPIFLYVRSKGKTLKVYTDRKCHWFGWDKIRGRANPRKFKGAIELNDFLSDLETEAASFYNLSLRKGHLISKEEIRKLIQKLSGTDQNKPTLIEFAEDFIEKSNLSPNTRKSYKTTINILQEYSNKRRKVLDFNDIDLNFYDDFTNYLWADKEFNDNTVGKNIKNIKALMNQAFERDLHTNLSHKKKGFKVLQRDADTVYLNESELKKIINADLEKNASLEKVRDIFYVACCLGLRFSDLVRVTKDKFIQEDGIDLFKIESEKTGRIVKVPVDPQIIPILERHDYNLPTISNQKLNKALKLLGEKAGIDEEIEVTDVKAGKKIRTMVRKYNLMTTHTARRSFASNLFIQGVRSLDIMAVTGHRTEKAFLTYLRLTHMEKIREIDKHFKSKNTRGKAA